ncbi:phosphate acyltransferase [Clostridiaceae bacterium M8S5]|nr:phosphate acyltransferase [Clostridiaceae bacterium M8S5]
MIKSFKELETMLMEKKEKPTLAVVCAHDEHTLEAIKDAMDKELIKAVLVGKEEMIKELLEKMNFVSEDIRIIDAKTDEESAAIGVKLVREEAVQALMKGKIQTKDFLKAVVNSETGIKNSEVLSHMAVHELKNYHKLLAVTDGGMVTYPDFEQKKAIVKNATNIYNNLGYEKPKVAVLAAVEVVNPKMQETVDAHNLKLANIPDCIVEGPISYDLTFSKESAEIKGYESPVVGDADILVVPNIATGNILGKSLIYSAEATMAGIVVGAKVPIILTSRGSTSIEKYYSIVLATLSH